MSTEVRTHADGFTVREGWWRHTKVKWSAVATIYARRADQVTYNEIFLVFELANGKSVSVGELDKGFATFREALADAFPDMEIDWYALAETYGGKPVQVWPSSISAS